jgi:phenylacetate-coenzyme A ligase PaaK-like adenylate-forming protein
MHLPVGFSARRVIDFSREMSIALRDRIFNIKGESEFLETALEVFHYQYNKNSVYQHFTNSLGMDPSSVKTLAGIPFLPVEFFRNHKIISGDRQNEIIFESSGTTGVIPGKHFVSDLGLYEENFLSSFRMFYGEPEEFVIAALLPSYTEREGSSLVYMADKLIKWSNNKYSGFYRENTSELIVNLNSAKLKGKKTLLIGVSFALLDLAENTAPDLSGVIVMETGGMKGRRKELTRAELHAILKEKFNVSSIHSEYGMTELMSQAYSSGEGIFYTPPWMNIIIRDPQDPLTVYSEVNKTGGINIIDLANINSCSFIATSDLGRLHEDGGFEVVGRFDNSDIRGCNLLAD